MNLSSPAAVSSLLRRHHFLPSHKLGQNFLVDANILRKIVAAGDLSEGDTVLEVGTGLGVLTCALADAVGNGGRVISVERDSRLAPILSETLPTVDFPQVRLMEGDILDFDFAGMMSGPVGSEPLRGISVVANIPYSITSPLLSKLLESETRFRTIVLLVQKEVGERLAASPGDDAYGAFGVFVQYHAVVEIVAPVSRFVFFPPPKIASAIVRIRPRSAPAVEVGDAGLLFQIVRSSFQQRRKTLLNALSSELLGWDKSQAQSILESAEIDGRRRGETLSLEEFAAIEKSAANFAPSNR